MSMQAHDKAGIVAIAVSISMLAAALAGAQQAQTPPPAAPPAPAAQSAPEPVPFAPASTPDQEKLRVVPAKRLGGKVHLLRLVEHGSGFLLAEAAFTVDSFLFVGFSVNFALLAKFFTLFTQGFECP